MGTCAMRSSLSESVDWRSFAAGLLLPLLLLLLRAVVRTIKSAIAVRPDSKSRPGGLKVVIQGSTRGLGLHLARQFLALGDAVVISSRDAAAVEECAKQLREEFPGRQVVAAAADASKADDVEALAERAMQELGQIDIWIANAGLSAQRKMPLACTPAEELTAIVATNLTGALLGARAAISRMLTQPSGGKVFLVDGSGSQGNPTPGNAAYGATKHALVQLKASLASEVKGTAVGVHLFSPGMVATDLLLRYADNPRSARFINILAEDPARVAAWLVPRIRGAKGNGQYPRYLTVWGVAWRFATAARRRGRFVSEGDCGSAATAASSAGYQRLAQSAQPEAQQQGRPSD